MKNFKLLAIVFVLLSFIGCGNSSDTVTDRVTQSANELVGTWSSGCDKSIHSDINESDKLLAIFSSSNIDITYKEYNGTTCDETKIIYHRESKYMYTIGNATKYDNGMVAKELDITLMSFSLKTGSLNYIPQTGKIEYSMYSTDGNKLYISEEDDKGKFDGSSAEKRMNKYDGVDYLTKQ